MSFVPPKVDFSGQNALIPGTTFARRIQLKKASDGSVLSLSIWSDFRCQFKDKATNAGGVVTNCPQPGITVVDAANGIVELLFSTWPTFATAVKAGVYDIEMTLTGSSPARTERIVYGAWSYRDQPFAAIAAGYDTP